MTWQADCRNINQDLADVEKLCTHARYVKILDFAHFTKEFVGMDGGYKATLHSFIPYEAQKDQGSPEYAAMSPLERVTNRMNRCWNHVFRHSAIAHRAHVW